MTDQLFCDTHVPLPRRIRFKRAVSGVFTHPMVQLAIVTFWVVTIACTIVVVVVNRWAL